MKKFLFVFLIQILLGSGCSTLKVIPDVGTAGVINSKENSLTISKDSLSITVKAATVELNASSLEGMITPFFIEIDNQKADEISFDLNSFVLVDNDNRQYYSLSPEKVKEIIAKDTFYLLPYPYVGFYYLEDYEKSAFKTATSSELPYYYEFHPQDIFSKALNAESIIPKAKVSGLVYFRADMYSLKGVKVLIYKKGTSKSSQPDFSFPFRVVK